MTLEQKRQVILSLIANLGSAIRNKQEVDIAGGLFASDELEVLLAACRQYETLDRVTALTQVGTALASSLAAMIDVFERHISGRPGPDDVAKRWDDARDALSDFQFLMSRPEGADRVAN